MHQVSQCHSNSVTTPSSCILLTLYSVLNQNLTCRTLSSFCRIPFILGKLKIEVTKNPLLHAGMNGEHSCGENSYNGDENGEHSCGKKFHGNNIKRHIKSHHTWQCFKHPCSLDDNQHMDTSHVSSKHVKETPKHRPSFSGVDWDGLKRENPNIDPASWKYQYPPVKNNRILS